ncbi:MAG TPA: ABC transporter permease [Parvularcula sp.]|nr:ABC transporter permease [Parvularcula sp.]HBS32506.1 ABC transporter permease [Parvularcula sp.]HBS34022.1 ABC transporter permease [Parvularcula sp.]
MTPAAFSTDLDNGILRLKAAGDWQARHLGAIDEALRDFEDDAVGRELIIDISGVGRLDTAGAMVLERVLRACSRRTQASRIVGGSEAHQTLIANVAPHVAPCEVEPARRNAFLMMVNRLGKGIVEGYYAALEILNFVGLTLTTFARVIREPSRLRVTSIFYHMEEAGVNAMPIVGLMSFMIGAVVAFMGAKILRLFNAEVFTVELVGISVLREFGVLLAAILVAGRSGSAFTAAIGAMKIREEIDAMKALGLDPVETLVIPRAIALILMMPVLTFMASILGVIGGGLVAATAMEISPAFFVGRLQETIALSNFWVGLIKAPFFAFVIAIIGCYQGMEVAGSSESLGQRTTLSVVQSLFIVIILDAFFAMFFLEIDY